MIETLTADQVANVLDSGSYDLVDVREEQEWRAGHIPGTRVVPLDQLRANPESVLPKRENIIFICARGTRALTAAKIAERFGYTRLYNLDGGTYAWTKAGLPLVVEPSVAVAA
jgi:rhodanese-related sulfurtransferase